MYLTVKKSTLKHGRAISRRRLPLLLVIGVFLAGVGFTFVCLSLYSVFKNIKLGKSKIITVNNVSPEVANEISKKLVYSVATNEPAEYYSPNLDILFHYRPDKYRLSEFYKTVSFSSTQRIFSLGEFADVGLLEADKVTSTPSQYFIDKYEAMYPGLQILDQGKEQELFFVKIMYSTKDPLNKIKEKKSLRLIFVKKTNDKYLYADFLYGELYDINLVKEDLKQLLLTAEVSPKNVEKEITLQVIELGVRFPVNRLKWNVGSVSSSSLFINFRTANFEVKPKLAENSSTSLAVSEGINKYEGEKSLRKEMDEQIAILNEEPARKQVKIISQNETETIGGLEFIKLVYQELSLGEPYYHLNYYGYNPKSEHSLTFKVYTKDLESEGFRDVKKIFEKTEFFEPSAKTSSGKSERKVLGTSSITIEKSSLIGVNSVVHVFNRSCVQINSLPDPSMPLSGGKSYNICSAATGSGFFTNEDGYIVTNAHVSQPNPFDLVVGNLSWAVESGKLPRGFWSDFANDVNTLLLSTGKECDLQEFLGIVLLAFNDLYDGKRITLTPTYENYIESTQPFKVTDFETFTLDNAAQEIKANLIDGNNTDSFFKINLALISGQKAGIAKPDLALLKVEGGEFPGLNIADASLVAVGQLIQAIGFPGAAEGGQIFSSESSIIPTLTKGTISAIKPNFDNTFKMIQIDASIAHGNSGGPVVNQDSEVVGVCTYGLGQEEAANFNVAISGEAVTGFLTKNGVKSEEGKVGTLIRSGADYFGKSYYKWAVRDFEKAVQLYLPTSSTLSPLIAVAKSKIQKGEDRTPLIKAGSLELSTMAVILLGVGLLFLVIGSVVIIVILKKKGARPPPPSVSVPPTSVVKPLTPPPPPTVFPGVSPTANQVPVQ